MGIAEILDSLPRSPSLGLLKTDNMEIYFGFTPGNSIDSLNKDTLEPFFKVLDEIEEGATAKLVVLQSKALAKEVERTFYAIQVSKHKISPLDEEDFSREVFLFLEALKLAEND